MARAFSITHLAPFLSGQAAVLKKIEGEFLDFSGFLTRLNKGGGGFLFQHGWVVELLAGLLKVDPSERLSVAGGRELVIGSQALQASSWRSASRQQRPQGAYSSSPPTWLTKRNGARAGIAAEEVQLLRDAFDSADVDRTFAAGWKTPGVGEHNA
jgi:hypothetical protein